MKHPRPLNIGNDGCDEATCELGELVAIDRDPETHSPVLEYQPASVYMSVGAHLYLEEVDKLIGWLATSREWLKAQKPIDDKAMKERPT